MRQFHTKTAYEMTKELREMLFALPVVQFQNLQAEIVYHFKPSYGTERVLTVNRLLPSRKIADVTHYGDERPQRVTSTRYRGEFRALSSELLSWMSATHEQLIDMAITQGLEVPPRVRVHYPEKFVELPERFDLKQMQKVLKPEWGKFVNEQFVIEMIEQRHAGIRRLDLELPKVAAMNPALVADYEKYIADHNADIDFYRWLLPHVSKGGIFHIEEHQP